VVSLRFDLGEGGSAALDFVGDDVLGGGFPDEGRGVGVPVDGLRRDGFGEVGGARDDPARRRRSSVRSLNDRPTRFTHEVEVGV
jgi:hypothetical protein